MATIKTKRPPGGEHAGAATVEAVETPGLNIAIEQALVNKRTVAKAAAVSQRCIEQWVRQRKIPIVRLSPRCVRFHLPSVMVALRRFEQKEVR